jgi:hypothetical protein
MLSFDAHWTVLSSTKTASKLSVTYINILHILPLPTRIYPSEDKFDTCGWRISPVPHIHYSGNMWWATCSHIRSLISPDSFEVNDTLRNGSMNIVSPDSKSWRNNLNTATQIRKCIKALMSPFLSQSSRPSLFIHSFHQRHSDLVASSRRVG